MGHVVSAGEFYRTEVTLESYAELTDVSATAIRREQAEVLRQVRRLKARLERRQQPSKRRKTMR